VVRFHPSPPHAGVENWLSHQPHKLKTECSNHSPATIENWPSVAGPDVVLTPTESKATYLSRKRHCAPRLGLCTRGGRFHSVVPSGQFPCDLLAQLVERLCEEQKAEGSSPSEITNLKTVEPRSIQSPLISWVWKKSQFATGHREPIRHADPRRFGKGRGVLGWNTEVGHCRCVGSTVFRLPGLCITPS
jgi:hypothetical protein